MGAHFLLVLTLKKEARRMLEERCLLIAKDFVGLLTKVAVALLADVLASEQCQQTELGPSDH
jgi:hypothetical protein